MKSSRRPNAFASEMRWFVVLAVLSATNFACSTNTSQTPIGPADTEQQGRITDENDPSAAPGACRSACELSSRCSEPESAHPSQAQTEADWNAPDQCATEATCTSVCSEFVVEGACTQGLTFLARHNGTVGEVRYFDRGTFLGLATSTDDVDPECHGQSFWPTPVTCDQAQITKVLCGETTWRPGQRIGLPWADGENPSPAPFALVD